MYPKFHNIQYKHENFTIHILIKIFTKVNKYSMRWSKIYSSETAWSKLIKAKEL